MSNVNHSASMELLEDLRDSNEGLKRIEYLRKLAFIEIGLREYIEWMNYNVTNIIGVDVSKKIQLADLKKILSGEVGKEELQRRGLLGRFLDD